MKFDTSVMPPVERLPARFESCVSRSGIIRPIAQIRSGPTLVRAASTSRQCPCRSFNSVPSGLMRSEGLRIGTVRRPPRGVPKAKFASENWYDVWLPDLAPSAATVKLGQKAETDARVEGVWQALREGDVVAVAAPVARSARRAVAYDGLLGGLLLRGRIALPPLGPAPNAQGARGEDCLREEIR